MFKQNEISLYLKDVRKTKQLTKEEEYDLALRIQQGDQKAADQLILANLRFVISIARQYQNVGIELSDLISEGNLGLIKAAKRYNPSLGNKFISYAVWWIKQCILQCINDNSRMIRIPINLSNELIKIKKQLNYDPEQTPLHHPTTVSYDDTLVNSDDEDYLPNRTFNDKELLPDEELIKKDTSLKQELFNSMFGLDNREKYIINEYFLRDDPRTLEEIGEAIDLTKERVRQIRDKSLRKIRNNSEHLFAFINKK
jgi:RNA polymerase primary sigma factor